MKVKGVEVNCSIKKGWRGTVIMVLSALQVLSAAGTASAQTIDVNRESVQALMMRPGVALFVDQDNGMPARGSSPRAAGWAVRRGAEIGRAHV